MLVFFAQALHCLHRADCTVSRVVGLGGTLYALSAAKGATMILCVIGLRYEA